MLIVVIAIKTSMLPLSAWRFMVVLRIFFTDIPMHYHRYICFPILYSTYTMSRIIIL